MAGYAGGPSRTANVFCSVCAAGSVAGVKGDPRHDYSGLGRSGGSGIYARAYRQGNQLPALRAGALAFVRSKDRSLGCLEDGRCYVALFNLDWSRAAHFGSFLSLFQKPRGLARIPMKRLLILILILASAAGAFYYSRQHQV